MNEKCCSNCNWWHYDRWTEEKYGMGVGVCMGDGNPTFCDHKGCIVHEKKEDA